MSPLNIVTQNTSTGPVLQIVGDLDYFTAPELRESASELTLRTGQLLVMDLAGLEFCDSSGINALLGVRSVARAHSADTALAAVPANLLRILRIAGLDHVFTFLPHA
ncbi:STAS domain-containing protein [Streptomyces sp. NBC_01465]|uniref:STAS domain-containing protein n=1 Tax=Streptomyces sp. NBC_01465 TaxID=2903878 RepID=UPI002E2F8B54|nr:STAS domain-containing protein [Streptomyces sp. NBC_01465]